jgi:hypothetical protein
MIFKSLARTETAAVVIHLLYSFFLLSDPKLRLLVFCFFRIWAPNAFVSVGDLSPPVDRLFTSPSRKGVSSQMLKKHICPAILSSDGFRQLYIILVWGSLVRFPPVARDYSLPQPSTPPLGRIQPFNKWLLGAPPPQVKRSGHQGDRPEYEGDHPPPSNAEVKKEWSYTSNFPHAFMASIGPHLLPLPILLKRNGEQSSPQQQRSYNIMQ